MEDKLICVGVITSAYHLKGLVKITPFTAQQKNICNMPCMDINGRSFLCKFIKNDKDKIICKIDDINSRTAAEGIIGTKLYIKRSDLPELSESEYYIEDIVGLDVIDISGNKLGSVKSLHNFGAGDIVEILLLNKKSEMYPFTADFFPEITNAYVRFTEGGIVICDPNEK